jgi:hypothetical protein
MIILIKENHGNCLSVIENIEATRSLLKASTCIIGVEGYDYTPPATISERSRIRENPAFAKKLNSEYGNIVFGVDSRSLCDEIECDLYDKKYKEAAAHPNQHKRSAVFLENLLSLLKTKPNSQIGVVCAGARHVDDITTILNGDARYQGCGFVVFESTSYTA